MRQAGIIAAPGIIALEKMIDRLREDHKNARFIAERIYRFRGIKLDLENVQTNIVIFDLDLPGISDESFLEMLKQEGVLALAESKNRIRLVTHYGINRKDSEAAVASVESVIEKLIK